MLPTYTIRKIFGYLPRFFRICNQNVPAGPRRARSDAAHGSAGIRNAQPDDSVGAGRHRLDRQAGRAGTVLGPHRRHSRSPKLAADLAMAVPGVLRASDRGRVHTDHLEHLHGEADPRLLERQSDAACGDSRAACKDLPAHHRILRVARRGRNQQGGKHLLCGGSAARLGALGAGRFRGAAELLACGVLADDRLRRALRPASVPGHGYHHAPEFRGAGPCRARSTRTSSRR